MSLYNMRIIVIVIKHVGFGYQLSTVSAWSQVVIEVRSLIILSANVLR